KSSLADYLGLPLTEGRFKVGNNQGRLDNNISLLPFLAYQKIWDEFYRDENLQASLFRDSNGDRAKDLFKDGV
ncbi:hypothetical protein OZ663_18630, partial [Elizabethkingia sp. HX CGY]